MYQFKEMNAVTCDYIVPMLTDNVFKPSPLFLQLAKGHHKKHTGGNQLEFEVVDRRKEKQAAEAAGPAVLEVIEAAVEKVVEFGKPEVLQGGKWKSIGYTLVYLGINNQQMLAGRAVGLRSDESLFTADWLLPPIWDRAMSWQAEALRRLDTFKKCECGSGRGVCVEHLKKCPGQFGPGKWIEEDMQRLRKVQTTPLCEALESIDEGRGSATERKDRRSREVSVRLFFYGHEQLSWTEYQPVEIRNSKDIDFLRGVEQRLGKVVEKYRRPGFTAPQMGIPIQMAVVRVRGVLITLLNPRIERMYGAETMYPETCISCPPGENRCRVPRMSVVEISSRIIDPPFVDQKWMFQGEDARIVQHSSWITWRVRSSLTGQVWWTRTRWSRSSMSGSLNSEKTDTHLRSEEEERWQAFQHTLRSMAGSSSVAAAART